jgi:hypothetical protein
MTKAYMSRIGLRYFPEIHEISKQLGRLGHVIGKSRLSVAAVFIVVVVVWILSPLTASAQQWEFIGKSFNGNMTQYYDKSSVKHLPDNIVQVTVKTDLAYEGEDFFIVLQLTSPEALCHTIHKEYVNNVDQVYSYNVEIEEINCKTREYRADSTTYYDQEGKVMCKQTYESLKGKWWSIDETKGKGADQTQIYQVICVISK